MTAGEATERAALHLDLGRPREALELVAPYLVSGEDPAPHALAVMALLALDRPDDAARTAGAALGMFGPLPGLARVASYAFRAVGMPDRALAVARAGVEHAPQWVPGLLALIKAELATGHLAEANAALAAAMSLAPESPDVRLLAADVALAGGRSRLAGEHCRAALSLDPANIAALRGLGLLDERRGRHGSAARWYARALRLRPGDEELAGRVRALFGRLLLPAFVVCLMVGVVTFIAFMAHADPAPGQPDPSDPSGPLSWALWIAGVGGLFVALTWVSLHGTPRAVLAAMVSESRSSRRLRRCTRLVLAHAVTAAATVLVALAPVGSARDRLPVVVPVWLASMVLGLAVCVALRRAFGFGMARAAAAHPRDMSVPE